MKTSVLLPTGLMFLMGSQLGGQGASQGSGSSPTAAVRSATPDASAVCDYNTCALRMKLSWGNWLIIRGEREQRVGKLGMFSATNLESIVASSPEAAAEARTFQKNYRPGEIFQGLGVFAMVFSAAAASGSDSAVWPIAGVAGGSAMLLYGVFRRVRAENALSKTIWLYNRSLPR